MVDYYPKVTGSPNFYSGVSTTEASMRDEIIRTLDGYYPEVAKAHPVLLRVARRDENYNTIPCSCVDPTTKECDKDRWCPICFSMGVLSDESWARAYRQYQAPNDSTNAFLNKLSPTGLFNIPAIIFYLRYSDTVETDDRIIEVKLDEEGSVLTPVTRKKIYRINLAEEYRADNGRVEYYRVLVHEESVKYLNPPTYG